MNSKNNLVLGVVVVGVAAVSFFGGIQYQKSQASEMPNFGAGMRNAQGRNNSEFGRPNNNQGNMGGRNGMIVGEVSSKDANSLTIKMSDGSSRIVILSDNTTYRMASEASSDKVEVGTKVAVMGNQGTDGSTTAENIEINPIARALDNPTTK